MRSTPTEITASGQDEMRALRLQSHQQITSIAMNLVYVQGRSRRAAQVQARQPYRSLQSFGVRNETLQRLRQAEALVLVEHEGSDPLVFMQRHSHHIVTA